MRVLVDGNQVDLKTLGLDELVALRERLELDAESIDTDLTMVRVKKFESGEYADPEWYARATLALKLKRRQLESIKQIVATKRKEERRAIAAKEKPLSDYFMQICKERMTPEIYEVVYQAAIQLKIKDEKA